MDQMVTLLPHLGPAVKALALRETAFSVEDATRMLEVFQSQNFERLSAIRAVRCVYVCVCVCVGVLVWVGGYLYMWVHICCCSYTTSFSTDCGIRLGHSK